MSSDPFRYRAPLTDADLDEQEAGWQVLDAFSVHHGWLTAEQAEQRHREAEAFRETKKAKDRSLEAYVDGMFSTDESDFSEETPLTPPRSPKRMPGLGLDLSFKAWRKECELMRLRERYDPRDFGFNDYETWKQYQIVHSQKPPVSDAEPSRSNVLNQPLPPDGLPSPPSLRVEAVPNPGAGKAPTLRLGSARTRARRISLER